MSKNATSRLVCDQILNQEIESFQLMRSYLLSMPWMNSNICNYEIFRQLNRTIIYLFSILRMSFIEICSSS
uniref:Uncharacterized protein n=1 Tax=Arundo donax TaxID=35708 RepID=A0A0A9GEF6_ARUDO